jgi:Flp pilus assembly protein protease CpaA
MGTILATAVTVISLGYAIYSDIKRRSVREWIHMALVNLKPSIQGPNQGAVILAINNMLEFLKPPQARSSR